MKTSDTIELNVAPKKVLVVARTLEGIAHWIVSLREAGCIVELARTPAEAIVRAAALSPEVVVIEDRAADLDSVELSLQIRSTVIGKLPPTFIMAAAHQPAVPSAELPPAHLATAQDYSRRRSAARQANRIAEIVPHRPAPAPLSSTDHMSCHGIHLDRTRHRAWVNGRTLHLTPTEFKLLWELARRPGEVLTRADLTTLCRGANSAVQARTVDAHIKSIRGKLQEQAQRIETVYGVGYRFQELDE